MKNILFWCLAFLITVSAAIYQRSTGPTYPKRYVIDFHDQPFKIKLIRSHTIDRDFFVTLKDAPEALEGSVFYKRYPTQDEWSEVVFLRDESNLNAQLPLQPPAGKLEYYLILKYKDEVIPVAENDPVIIRFKGSVPAGFMIPHILAMFLAMLFSTYTGILAIMKDSRFRKYAFWTLALLVLGGLIFGPIIQKYAFGDYWTGWPFGRDLTDNKTLIAVIFWGVATLLNLKKSRPWIAVVAALVLLAVYSIPHSTMGSELDYETGKVMTGMLVSE
jgi:hypothetical protein